MSLLSKKKSVAMIIITLSLTVMIGCSSTKKPLNETSNNNEIKNEVNDGQSSSINNSSDNSSQAKDDGAASSENNAQKTILDSIKKSAGEGKIINCDFPVKSTTLQDIEKKWGKSDKFEWIADAKGNYSTYSKNNVVFGTNKGDQVFEVRSFDSQLKQITLSDVKDYFGKPDHDIKYNGEEIIGYVSGNENKILFVFKEPTESNSNPQLDHYSILYPKGTVNNMAGDPGREW
jgi:hypothetical protein